MKTKGIPFWEQHLERLVLGVACLLFLGLLALQFIGNPFSVESGDVTFTPSNVDRELERIAEPIDTKLANSAPSQLEIETTDSVFEEFALQLDARIAPAEENMTVQYARRMEMVDDTPVDATYITPELPTAYEVVAAQYFDNVAESEVQTYETLAAHPQLADMPFDLSWVSVAAKFDLDSAFAVYEAGDRENDLHAIPQSWHGGRVDILDVIVERQELVDGAWTGDTTLEQLPGRFTFRDELIKKIDRGTGEQIVEASREHVYREQVLQPSFFATKNDSWTLPEPKSEGNADLTPEELLIEELQNQLRRYEAEKARAENDLAAAGGPVEEEDDPGTGGGNEGGGRDPGGSGGGGRGDGGGRGAPPGTGGGLGSGAGGGGGGPPGRRTPGTSRTDIRSKADRKKLMTRIDRLSKRIDAIIMSLADLGIEVGAPEVVTLDHAGVINLWAHDINVEAGRTYRYRFTVEVFNPFFRHALALRKEQESLAENFSNRTVASDWSDPIVVEPPLHIFVDRAMAPGDAGQTDALSMGQATFEVFRFFDGRWWSEQFTVYPGDRVGQPKESRHGSDSTLIDYTTDWFVVDVVQDLDAPDVGMTRGRGAMVYLMDLNTGAAAPPRSPRLDEIDPDRQWLEVESDISG